ncbi:MAG: DUF58 domain-containing protein [Bacteroidetes bacterium]|nr:DUF58 domain-containing protein [Bacteroidota bacterium]
MNTAELIKSIRTLEIKTKGLTKQVFSGQYKSAFKGRGMAFSEVRDYQIGDEIRTIDWNVTARYNSPFVKVFEEERELTVMLLVDISGSSEFGFELRSKKQRQIEIAATLAFSALANNDKVGAILFSDQIELYISPQKGREHILLILRQLIEFEAKSQGTNLTEALKFLRNTHKKRSISFLISDFECENPFMEDAKRTKKHHDLVAIKVNDCSEQKIPLSGWIQFFNSETNETTWVNAGSESTQQLFKNEFESRENSLSDEFKHSGIDHVFIDTEQNIVPPLVQLFKSRR